MALTLYLLRPRSLKSRFWNEVESFHSGSGSQSKVFKVTHECKRVNTNLCIRSNSIENE